MKAIQAIYMVYRPCDLYESDSSPCDINHQKDYTACVTSMKAIQAPVINIQRRKSNLKVI
jgi:hypothetical protein